MRFLKGPDKKFEYVNLARYKNKDRYFPNRKLKVNILLRDIKFKEH